MSASDRLADRVDALVQALEGLERRLDQIERHVRAEDRGEPIVAGVVEPEVLEIPASESRARRRRLTETLSFVGRTLLFLGGAYILRALTETEVLPPGLGVGFGLVYAVGGIVLAWRAAGRGLLDSAAAHGAAAAAVGFPLVWETTARFSLLSPPVGAALLLAFTGMLYGTAWHRQLGSVAWIAGVGGLVTATATMFGSSDLPPFVGTLVLLAGLVLATERSRGWEPLAWVTCAAADLAVLALTLALVLERGTVNPGPALVSQLLLPASSLGVLGFLAARERRPIDTLAIAQSAVAALFGLGGAFVSLLWIPRFAVEVGACTLLLGVVAYLVAFRVVDRARRRPFHYFGTVGTALTLFGSGLLLERPELVWALLVPVAAVTGWRLRRLSLGLHAAFYAAAAAVGSGLIGDGFLVFVTATWKPPGVAALLALAATIAALVIPVPESPYRGPLRGAFRFVLLAIALWGLSALAVRAGASILGSESGEALAGGWLAALRTVVLALAAITLGVIGRWPVLHPARWLVYPVLAIGAVKLLLQDFLAGNPASMVVSFVAYGTALIVAPRVGRDAEETQLPEEEELRPSAEMRPQKPR